MQFSEEDIEEMLDVDEPYKYPPKEYDRHFAGYWTDESSIKRCVGRVLETGLPQVIETSYNHNIVMRGSIMSGIYGAYTSTVVVCLNRTDVKIPEEFVFGIIEVSKYNLTPLGVISLQSKMARKAAEMDKLDYPIIAYNFDNRYRFYMELMREKTGQSKI